MKLRFKNIICTCIAFAGVASAQAQVLEHERLLSFEESQIPSFITTKGAYIKLSEERFKDGKQSLMWEFKPNATLDIKKELNFEPKDASGIDTYLSTFTLWVYNTTPIDDSIEFQFLKDGKKCSSFPMNMNYTGWRAIYASYERDMNGHPEEGMNEIKIQAPDASGKVYLDLLITAAKADHRHHTPDIHLPFLNKGITNHWLIMLANSRIAPDVELYPTANENLTKDYQEIATIDGRLKELISSKTTVNDKKIAALRKEYNSYDITYKDGVVTGKSLFFARWAESFERLQEGWYKNLYVKTGQEYQKYFNLMFKLANNYQNTTNKEYQKELGDMFLNMYRHATDQGIAYGSGLGNATHYGYSFRTMFTSYYLMKELLAEHGLLEDASKTLQWYAQTNETFIRPEKDGIDMDSFNTLSMGRICSVLIMNDSPEKVQYLKAFARWIDTGCKPSPGLDGAFKVDGGAFHHRNNYPAYAVGGLNGATNMLYLLSNTSFAVSELGHATLKNVLLTMRFYCNKTYFPLAMSGRHPDGKGEIIPLHYARMALAGTPDKRAKVDADMAAAYLRLVSSNTSEEKPEYMPKSSPSEVKAFTKIFSDNNIVAEPNPSGNIALAYGCVSAHRRDNWVAVARGHSRYLWAAEHYLGANLYGRYLAHGSLQLLTANENEEVTPETSGWLQPGFDWGRIPGATALHLPVEQLKANVLNVDVFSGFEEMLYSDEAFAGGLSHNKQDGLFAMKLHEHDKYNGGLRANKSYHFFGNKIICLGSDIVNDVDSYNTETTIFQTTGATEAFTNYWNNYQEHPAFWIDQLGTGYFVPERAENKLTFEKNFPQQSRLQNTGEVSEGNWTNLVINHGKAPKGAGYEYVMLPQTDVTTKNVAKVAQSYTVLQKDSKAHIVKDNQSNTTSFALFEVPTTIPSKIVKAVDASCLMMLTEAKKEIDLTVTNPDLALYQGESDELFDENGKRVERSIYSRPWIGNASQTMPVQVTLNGKWMVENNDGFVKVNVKKNTTIIEFQSKDGASINVKLRLIN